MSEQGTGSVLNETRYRRNRVLVSVQGARCVLTEPLCRNLVLEVHQNSVSEQGTGRVLTETHSVSEQGTGRVLTETHSVSEQGTGSALKTRSVSEQGTGSVLKLGVGTGYWTDCTKNSVSEQGTGSVQKLGVGTGYWTDCTKTSVSENRVLEVYSNSVPEQGILEVSRRVLQ